MLQFYAEKARRRASVAMVFGLIAAIGGTGKTVWAQNTVTVPQALTTVEGNSFTDLPFISSPLGISLLQYIPATENGNVAGLQVGDRINALRFRLDNAANTNPFGISATDYDVYLGQGVAALPIGTSPASPGRQYNNYYVAGTRQQVRDGRLDVPANSFSSSQSGTTPEDFGPPVGFGVYNSSGAQTQAREYVYQGGALVYELRFSGVTSVPVNDRIRVDFESNSATANGYVLLFNQDTGANATTADYRLDQYTLVTGFDLVAAVPEPASIALAAVAAGLGGIVRGRRKLAA